MSPQEVLKKHWGYSSLFDTQEKAISALLEGRDALVLLPTGAGKSLCFQIPALLRPGLCLVISPLISLMKDQVEGLRKRGIPAAYWEGSEYMGDGQDQRKFLYISAERLQNEEFQEKIAQQRICLVAIDEAHCISQWGHDFRPAYRKIRQFRREPFWKSIPFIALTATATPETEADILEQIPLINPEIVRSSFERKNIYYQVLYSENKFEDLQKFLDTSPGRGIIYTSSRKKSEFLSEGLRAQGIPSLSYHAGMDRRERERNQQEWAENPEQIMVATTAFGMGIDQPDLRFVVHYDFPSSLEQYFQETGRAGRDGLPARALLFYSPEDIPPYRALQEGRIPPIPYLRSVYQAVCDYLQIPVGSEPDRLFPFDMEAFCQRFSQSPLRAWNALQFLEREGYWTLVDRPRTLARIRILPHPPLDQGFRESEPEVWALIKALWRWRGDLYDRAAPFSFPQMMSRMQVDYSRLKRRIERALALGLIRWYPATQGLHIHFHHYRVDSAHLQIPYTHWQQIRDIHRGKSEKLLEYLDLPGNCRVGFLLDYFGEKLPLPCGHCDLCTPPPDSAPQPR